MEKIREDEKKPRHAYLPSDQLLSQNHGKRYLAFYGPCL